MTDWFRGAERLMAMDDATWRRHCNPLSGWSRLVTTLPLLCLAIWSRTWLGWGSVVPVLLACAWIWWNPRAFPEPQRFDSWMSRGVLGERIFLDHRATLALHHVRMARVLSALSVPGAIVMICGLATFWWEGVVFGMILTALPKVWFVDRMVWIFDDWRRAGRPVPGMQEHEL